MLKLLKLNRAILFLILTVPWIIDYFYKFDDWNNYAAFSILRYFLLFLWFIGLSVELNKRIPKSVSVSDTFFLINIFLIFLLYCCSYLFLEPGKNYSVSGLDALPYIPIFIYLLYAFINIYSYLSMLLTSIEEGREVEFSKRIGEMVLFFFFFIGVWWLQPRIIKALDKPEIESNS